MISANDIIEACAKACDNRAKFDFPWGSENTDRYRAQAEWAAQCAKDIRALKSQYGNAILCEREPVAYQYSVQPQVLGDCYFAFSEQQDTPDAKPLYRAKEPTK
jgi:hypothetical protein